MTDDYLLRAHAVAEHLERAFATMFHPWPLGHCTIVSLLSVPFLRTMDTKLGWVVVAGHVRDCQGHFWIQSRWGDVVDLSYHQWEGPPVRSIAAHEVVDYCPQLELSRAEENRARDSIRSSHGGVAFRGAGSELRGLLARHDGRHLLEKTR